MYRGPIPRERATMLLPVAEPPSAPDGVVALLRALLRAARRTRVGLALWCLACIAAAALYAFTATPTYTATASLLLDPRRPAPSAGQDVAAQLDTSRAESELQVLRSERLLAHVFQKLNLVDHPGFAPKPPGPIDLLRRRIEDALHVVRRPPTPEEIRQTTFEAFSRDLTARRVGQSYVVEVSYTATDRNLARQVANAAVSAYLWQSLVVKADAAKSGAEFIQGRMNALAVEVQAAAAAVAAGSLPAAPTPDADARVIGAALQPLKPSAPRKPLVLLLGIAVGLFGGFLAVAVSHALDRRVRHRSDIESKTGTNCLAVIPELGRRIPASHHGRRMELASSRPTEPFGIALRELRSALEISMVGMVNKSNFAVALVSCTSRAGSTLIGSNLACLLRDTGACVTVIDADMSGAAAWEVLDPTSTTATGLAELLACGSADRPAHLAAGRGVTVIPARSSSGVGHPVVALGGPAMREVVEDARQTGCVILDLPPLSRVAEARAAALCADMVVVVAEAGRTTIDELDETVTTLRSAGANVVGAVLNRVRT